MNLGCYSVEANVLCLLVRESCGIGMALTTHRKDAEPKTSGRKSFCERTQQPHNDFSEIIHASVLIFPHSCADLECSDRPTLQATLHKYPLVAAMSEGREMTSEISEVTI